MNRRMFCTLVLIVCVAASVMMGRVAGYSSAVSYVAFWFAVLLAATTGWRAARRLRPSAAASDVALSAVILALASCVACTAAPGVFGQLTLGHVLVAQAILCAATLWPRHRPGRSLSLAGLRELPPSGIAAVAALFAFAAAFALWYAPMTLYDSVSYHLFFAGRWVQDHRIAIIPTPFSDEAQAYAPGNGEVVLAWLMLPFHGDLFARMGQLPFSLAGAIAVFAIARRLGASIAHAMYPAAFFMLSRPIVEEMVGANVDLICAACFLATVYFAVDGATRNDRSSWLLCGVSAGLYCGTKYVALVYVPVLLVLAFARGVRLRMLWAIPGIVAFGLPWYLRNWVEAGSPIYPSSLTLGGFTVATGAFTHAAMLNTIFHTSDVRLLPAMAAHGMGAALFIVWAPIAAVGWLVMARRGWWPAALLALAPLLMVPLYWFGLPVNTDPRFLMPALGLALLPVAFVFPGNRRWNACVHAAYAGVMAWLVVGAPISLPAKLPWFMGGWFNLDGLVLRPFTAWFALAAVAIGAAWLYLRRQSGEIALAGLLAATACAATTLAVVAPRWCGECIYLNTESPFIRAAYTMSWQWVDANIGGATIAYTGINLPYPLSGPQLTNRVVYVNIDGRTHWRFHDYDRAYRAGALVQSPPMLATSSGELMPVADRSGAREDALRPRYERMHGDREAWTFSLERSGVDYLFVAALSAYEIDYVWHNERGLPIEDEWAASDPARFHLVYQNPQVHIYSFDNIDKVVRG